MGVRIKVRRKEGKRRKGRNNWSKFEGGIWSFYSVYFFVQRDAWASITLVASRHRLIASTPCQPHCSLTISSHILMRYSHFWLRCRSFHYTLFIPTHFHHLPYYGISTPINSRSMKRLSISILSRNQSIASLSASVHSHHLTTPTILTFSWDATTSMSPPSTISTLE